MSSAKTCPSCSTVLPDGALPGALCPACSQSAVAQTIMMKAPTTELGTIGDFEILAKLGAGGMGAVYKARQVSLDRLVALKILPSQFADDPDYIARFQREAKIAAGFHHDNLVSVHNYGTADGVHYIAMELVEGDNLHQLLRHRRVDMAEALGITVYVAQGLKCGWDTARLVHRDIKPSNIYVSHDGHVKVGDLGLAKSLTSNTTGITHTGAMMGTPHYMSPEQCRGDKTIDFRADIYSLGCMLFEMLTGHPPYPGSDPAAIVHKHLHGAPPALLKELPICPMPVALLVGRMLKKSPRERHTSYEELITEIEALYEHLERGEQLDVAQFRRPVQRATPASTVSEGMPDWVYWAVGALILIAIPVLFLPKPEKKLAELADKPATPVPSKTTPRAAPIAVATPTPAPAAAPFTPWQPLLTDAEWQQTTPGKRELVDGRLHLLGPPVVLKPQPTADGAIRVRLWQKEEANTAGLLARMSTDGSTYKTEVRSTGIQLRYFPGGDSRASELLGQHTFPKPLQPGATVLVELRLQADRLTTLVDGAPVIDARDSRLTGPGQWGFMSIDGWFESAEVQTLLPAQAAVEPWQDLLADTAPIASQSRAPRRGEPLKGDLLTRGKYRDGAVRLRAVFTGQGGCALAVRERGWQERYSARLENAQTVSVYFVHEASTTHLRSIPLPQPLTVGREYQFELRIVGSRLTVSLDGVQLDTREHPLHVEPGRFGVGNYSNSDQPIQAVEFLDLDSPVTNPFGPWQPLFTDAEWKETVPGQREVVDGRMHLQNDVRVLKPLPVADGAIRARIQFREGSEKPGIQARVTPGKGRYKIEVGQTYADLYCYTPEGFRLARYTLPKPLQPGDTVLVELRLQGDRVTALVDGTVAIEARDSRVTAPGQWGVLADDGWFESVEVQTPLPAAADGWEDLLAKLTPEIVAQTGHGWSLKNGELFSPEGKIAATLPLSAKVSGASYRVRVKLRQLPANQVFHLVLPVADRMCGFDLEGRGRGDIYSSVTTVDGKWSSDLPGAVKGKLVKDTKPHDLEVAVHLDGANATITATLDTRPLYEWTGPTASLGQLKEWTTAEPGTLALGTWAGGWAVSEVKVKRLGAGGVSAAAATKAAPFVNTLGMQFVPVPIVGGPTGGQRVLFSVWDTRVQDYEAFATETKRAWRKPSFEQGPTHPVVMINWDDATAFCAWLTDRERKAGRLGANDRYRLPTDHEWSCAVGIGDQEDAGKLPEEKGGKLKDIFAWGTAWPPPEMAGNFAGDESGRTKGNGLLEGYHDDFPTSSPVGSFAANTLGLYDMVGNVHQWCEDWHDRAQTERVMRGASFGFTTRTTLPSSARFRFAPDARADRQGFRCVLEVAPRAAAATNSASAIVSAATKDAPFVNTLGMKFVPVPGTDVLFCIHETRNQDFLPFAVEGPLVDERWKGTTLNDPKRPADYPVGGTMWEDVHNYCLWLSRKEGRTYRLPTDREWSLAVGIGEQEKWDADTTPETVFKVPDQFPWGTAWPPPKGVGNFNDERRKASGAKVFSSANQSIDGYDDGFAGAAPVMSFPPNKLGIYDLAGNVSEWCEDWYDQKKTKHLMRGSAYAHGEAAFLRSSHRYPHALPGSENVGFRLVLVPPVVARHSNVETSTPQPTDSTLESRATSVTKDAPFINSIGMKFVPVPITGGPTDKQRVLFSVWDTRVQDYKVFATETKREWPNPGYKQGPTHPAAGVNWDDATAFCAWLTERERKTGGIGASAHYRLPSDHEWSCAVGIGEQEDAARLPSEKNGKIAEVFPWDTVWPPPDQAGNYWSEELRPLIAAGKYPWITGVLPGRHDGFAETSPVGSYAANRFGLYDMGGNVWQWCSDSFDRAQKDRVLRGPSWELSLGSNLLSSSRRASAPAIRGTAFGFRCVLKVATPPAATDAPAPSAADGWEDLLAKLTPELVAQTGQGWRLEGGALRSPDAKAATVPLPGGSLPGASYQVRVKIRQLASKGAFSLTLPVADRRVQFVLDGRYLSTAECWSGLQLVDGKPARQVPGSLRGQQVNDDRPHDLEVTVRLDGANAKITVTLDARPWYEWTGPPASFSMRPEWATTPADSLALGANQDDWEVSEVKVKRLAP